MDVPGGPIGESATPAGPAGIGRQQLTKWVAYSVVECCLNECEYLAKLN